MAYLLVLDESGQDHVDSPYEVLAGVSILDSRIWALITAIQNAEIYYFGQRITEHELELKAKKLLKRKVFKHAAQMPTIRGARRMRLARACLREGREAREQGRPARPTRMQLTALAQAKIMFVRRVLELCALHGARAFASIVDKDAPRGGVFLRKDYAFLFQNFFYYLDEQPEVQHGLVVFDERNRSQSHLLIDEMTKYFRSTAKGRLYASRIVPEPFFVHSDLTTLVQIADLMAYIIAWGVRLKHMTRPGRPELKKLAQAVCTMRHCAMRERNGKPFYTYSFNIIDDLRPRSEQERDLVEQSPAPSVNGAA